VRNPYISGIKAPAVALLLAASLAMADIPKPTTIGIFDRSKGSPKPCDPEKTGDRHYHEGNFHLLLTTCISTGANVKTGAITYACRDNDNGRWDLVATPADVATKKKTEAAQ
jgi:hypothetical protein